MSTSCIRSSQVVPPNGCLALTRISPGGGPDDAFSYPTFRELRDYNQGLSCVIASGAPHDVNLGVKRD